MLTLVLALALTTPTPSVPAPAPLPALTLTVTKTKTNTGAHVTLKNVGKEGVVVVLPGDGSESGWRTPILTWSFVPLDDTAKKSLAAPTKQEGRCGLMNPVSTSEVVAIAAGKDLVVNSWVADPRPPGPGKWSATLTWQNDPTLGQKGSEIADEDVKAAFAATDAFAVSAAPVVVTVK